MVNKDKPQLTLGQPAIYQIKVPGILDETLSDWITGMTLTVGSDENGMPITTVEVSADQAALHGLLRRLYSLGSPLISVICVEIYP